jgi:hypothetical protein
MKEDWIVIMESTERAEIFSFKSLLNLKKIESYILMPSKLQKSYRLYIPVDKVQLAPAMSS